MKNNGGPAFPSQEINQLYANEPVKNGMSLRDYFAAKAMQGVVVDMGITQTQTGFIAAVAYKIADAMLKAREETND